MWTCPKCDAEVTDSVRLCWICGTAPDGTEFPGTPLALPRMKPPTEHAIVPEAGVPRRFGLQKVMMMTVVYAVLFAVMTALGAHPLVFAGIAILFTGVAAAQALLFGGKRPRRASVVAGTVLSPMILTACILIAAWDVLNDEFLLLAIVASTMVSLLLGPFMGYAAGLFSAAVFLVHPEESKAPDDAAAGNGDPFAPVAVEAVGEDPATESSPNRGT